MAQISPISKTNPWLSPIINMTFFIIFIQQYDTIFSMKHNDHVDLLRPAHLPSGGAWADFGAGSGAFTLALRELIGPEAQIYAVDKDQAALNELERNYTARFGNAVNLHLLSGDFSRPLDLPRLDGVLMANSMHYTVDKLKLLRHVASFLKHGS